jgi:hypothetical protein
MKKQEQKDQNGQVNHHPKKEKMSHKSEKNEHLWELRVDLSGFANTTSGH